MMDKGIILPAKFNFFSLELDMIIPQQFGISLLIAFFRGTVCYFYLAHYLGAFSEAMRHRRQTCDLYDSRYCNYLTLIIYDNETPQ